MAGAASIVASDLLLCADAFALSLPFAHRSPWNPIMARKYSKKAGESVKRAMRKRKRGKLKSGKSKKKVKSRKQAIAIGLSEAREKGAKVPPKKKKKGGKKKGRKKKGRKKKGRKKKS
jgi:hypothetical protein